MRKTLIVVDMQNDFIDGALGTAEAFKIVPGVKAKIDSYLANGDEVIFTRDTHYENYLSTSEGRHLPVEHCIKGTNGWQIRKELQVDGAEVIDKVSFGYDGWASHKFEAVELCGLCTDICVVSNALIIKALNPEIPMVVDSVCTAGVTPATCQAALDTMRMCQIEIL